MGLFYYFQRNRREKQQLKTSLPLAQMNPMWVPHRRERCRVIADSGASTECHRCISVVALITVDQTKPSRRAKIFSSASSSKAPKNPQESSLEQGEWTLSSPALTTVSISDSIASDEPRFNSSHE
uniref:Uncharacterized protein n=1 Tax=Oryza meridionalis TaxID=40149 RepID=A0A0E0D273_9ORYZ